MRNVLTVFSIFIFLIQTASAQQSQTATKSVKEETVNLTTPACKFAFTVMEGKGLTETSIKFLRGMGYGIKGVPEGAGLPVKCDDISGSGWIDSAGDLQAFIAPAKGLFFERSGSGSKPVDGKLHVITKTLAFGGKQVEGTYVLYSGTPLGQYSVRLFKDIGIGVKGAASPVAVRLDQGKSHKGMMTVSGVLTISDEAWPN